MIKLFQDTSNNISFPSNSRKVMLLIDGNYYRLEIEKKINYRTNTEEKGDFKNLDIIYFLYREQDQIDFPIAVANISLHNEDNYYHVGFKKLPKEFFMIEGINVEKKYRGLGTPLLSYIMNDIKKFNQLQGKNLEILLMRTQTEITKPFYAKFGARDNSTFNPEHILFHFMIIDKPKVVGELPKELADDFDYSSINQQNPFESPQMN